VTECIPLWWVSSAATRSCLARSLVLGACWYTQFRGGHTGPAHPTPTHESLVFIRWHRREHTRAHVERHLHRTQALMHATRPCSTATQQPWLQSARKARSNPPGLYLSFLLTSLPLPLRSAPERTVAPQPDAPPSLRGPWP